MEISPQSSSSKIRRSFAVTGLFGIAMGILEAIVAVYLRQIYYPRGFDFPLTIIPPEMYLMECLREAATIIMLVAIAIIAGRDNLQRFAYFLYTFAVWDIFYYVWLKLILNWPPSLLTWDVLFLIPITWIAPVLAPIIVSLTMILFGTIIICLQEKGCIVKINLLEWSLSFLGAFVILFTFVWDYSKIVVRELFISNFENVENTRHFLEVISSYKPIHYNWYLFALGEAFILCTLVLIYRRARGRIRDDQKCD